MWLGMITKASMQCWESGPVSSARHFRRFGLAGKVASHHLRLHRTGSSVARANRHEILPRRLVVAGGEPAGKPCIAPVFAHQQEHGVKNPIFFAGFLKEAGKPASYANRKKRSSKRRISQKMRSWRLRLPKVPILDTAKDKRNSFSLRVPRSKRRYCTLKPQQSVL